MYNSRFATPSCSALKRSPKVLHVGTYSFTYDGYHPPIFSLQIALTHTKCKQRRSHHMSITSAQGHASIAAPIWSATLHCSAAKALYPPLKYQLKCRYRPPKPTHIILYRTEF